jgi:pre-mRNA-splicing factor CWC22
MPDDAEKDAPRRGGGEGQDENESLEEYRKRKIASLEGLGRAGGVYVPPFKLQRLQKELANKQGEEAQRQAWEALRKSINGLVNKVNADNMKLMIGEVLQENLVRGRGLFARAVIRAQMASPTFTHVYACLVALVNSRLPEIGDLIIRRVILQFRRAYKRNDKIVLTAAVQFLAHLFNQKVVSEFLILQVGMLLLDKVTDDSIEVCCSFLQQCGQILEEVSAQGARAVTERLRLILREGLASQRTQYVIEGLMETRRTKYKEFPGIIEQLDLLDEDDQLTHEVDLMAKDIKGEEVTNVFHAQSPEDWERDNKAWEKLSAKLLGKESDDDDDDDDDDSDSSSDSDGAPAVEQKTTEIKDNTAQDLVNLRRNIYLVIQSSLGFEECVHKILKLQMNEGDEKEIVTMLIDSCAMQKSYDKFFTLIMERLARLKPDIYVPLCDNAFLSQLDSAHRLETNKLRNIAKFFSHLMYTDAVTWSLLAHLELTESGTTSSSRIFIKILFQDLSENLGAKKLHARMKDEELQPYVRGLFQEGNVKDMRFCINFFSAVGLGFLTEDLRERLSQMQQAGKSGLNIHAKAESSSGSDSDSDSDSSSSSSSSS